MTVTTGRKQPLYGVTLGDKGKRNIINILKTVTTMEQTIEEKMVATAEWEYDLFTLTRRCKENWQVNFDPEVKDIVRAIDDVVLVIENYRTKLSKEL